MKRIFILTIFLAIIGTGMYVWWEHGVSAVNPSDHTRQLFVIEKGQGIRTISENLKTSGLIKDPVIFFLVIKRFGLEGKIQAGEFHLAPDMDAFAVAKALQVGTFDLQITVPEGKRAEEIA